MKEEYHNPLVSVIMITYQHEKYIKDAIEGVFKQKTNFSVELIIANDYSPDNTDKIIKETITNAPQNIKVKYFSHKQNLGMTKNFVSALKKAQGKYIAICEGDDYWIDPYKLQTQINFLEHHPDYSMCCHNVYFLNNKELITNNVFDKYTKGTYSIEDLAIENFIPTLSSVFRSRKITFPEWYYTSPMGDYPLWLWISLNGKIMFFKKKMGVYRQNVGIWSGKPKNYKKIINLLSNMIEELKNNPIAKKNISIQRTRYIKLMLLNTSLKKIIESSFFYELGWKDRLIILLKTTLKI